MVKMPNAPSNIFDSNSICMLTSRLPPAAGNSIPMLISSDLLSFSFRISLSIMPFLPCSFLRDAWRSGLGLRAVSQSCSLSGRLNAEPPDHHGRREVLRHQPGDHMHRGGMGGARRRQPQRPPARRQLLRAAGSARADAAARVAVRLGREADEEEGRAAAGLDPPRRCLGTQGVDLGVPTEVPRRSRERGRHGDGCAVVDVVRVKDSK